MDIRHADDRLQRLETDLAYDAGFAPDTVQVFRRRMAQIRAARDTADLAALKSLDFKQSHSNDDSRYRLALGARVRLLMQLNDKPSPPRVTVLGIENESEGEKH